MTKKAMTAAEKRAAEEWTERKAEIEALDEALREDTPVVLAGVKRAEAIVARVFPDVARGVDPEKYVALILDVHQHVEDFVESPGEAQLLDDLLVARLEVMRGFITARGGTPAQTMELYGRIDDGEGDEE